MPPAPRSLGRTLVIGAVLAVSAGSAASADRRPGATDDPAAALRAEIALFAALLAAPAGAPELAALLKAEERLPEALAPLSPDPAPRRALLTAWARLLDQAHASTQPPPGGAPPAPALEALRAAVESRREVARWAVEEDAEKLQALPEAFATELEDLGAGGSEAPGAPFQAAVQTLESTHRRLEGLLRNPLAPAEVRIRALDAVGAGLRAWIQAWELPVARQHWQEGIALAGRLALLEPRPEARTTALLAPSLRLATLAGEAPERRDRIKALEALDGSAVALWEVPGLSAEERPPFRERLLELLGARLSSVPRRLEAAQLAPGPPGGEESRARRPVRGAHLVDVSFVYRSRGRGGGYKDYRVAQGLAGGPAGPPWFYLTAGEEFRLTYALELAEGGLEELRRIAVFVEAGAAGTRVEPRLPSAVLEGYAYLVDQRPGSPVGPCFVRLEPERPDSARGAPSAGERAPAPELEALREWLADHGKLAGLEGNPTAVLRCTGPPGS